MDLLRARQAYSYHPSGLKEAYWLLKSLQVIVKAALCTIVYILLHRVEPLQAMLRYRTRTIFATVIVHASSITVLRMETISTLEAKSPDCACVRMTKMTLYTYLRAHLSHQRGWSSWL